MYLSFFLPLHSYFFLYFCTSLFSTIALILLLLRLYFSFSTIRLILLPLLLYFSFSTIALILLPLLLYFSFFYHCTHTSSITFVTSLFLPLHFHTSSIAFILHSFFLYHCTFIRNPFIKYFSLFIDTFPFSSTFE